MGNFEAGRHRKKLRSGVRSHSLWGYSVLYGERIVAKIDQVLFKYTYFDSFFTFFAQLIITYIYHIVVFINRAFFTL